MVRRKKYRKQNAGTTGISQSSIITAYLRKVDSGFEERKKANPILAEAARHGVQNREEISKSALCRCYCCLKTFPSEAIYDWWDLPKDSAGTGTEVLGMTAVCPFCGVDSVLGDQCGYELSEVFLKEMQQHWFRNDGAALILRVSATKRKSPPRSHK